MSSRKVREILRQRRIEFDAEVEANRREAEEATEEPVEEVEEEKPKKRGRPKKKD